MNDFWWSFLMKMCILGGKSSSVSPIHFQITNICVHPKVFFSLTCIGWIVSPILNSCVQSLTSYSSECDCFCYGIFRKTVSSNKLDSIYLGLYEREKLGQWQTDAEETRRWPSTNQGKSSQKRPTLRILDFKLVDSSV